MDSEINGSKTQIIVAALGLIGVLAGALFANWDKIFAPKPVPTLSSSPDGTTMVVKSPEPPVADPAEDHNTAAPLPEINLSGVWRDNWGNTSQITQQGSSYTYIAWGTACNGGFFKTTGTGTIRGNTVESDYQSNISRGSCSGSVSSDGRRMTLICNDSVCNQFSSNAVKQ